MKIGSWEIRRRVLVTFATSLVAAASWHSWRMRTEPAVTAAPVRETPRAFVRVGGHTEGNLLREQAVYSDPTPLFFPTEQNYGQGREVTALQRQPGEEFRTFPASYQFPEQKLPAYGVESDVAPARAADMLSRGDLAPFAGFGEAGRQLPALASRVGFIEVKSLMSGEIVRSQPLAEVELPQREFAPVEFLVAVVPGGVIGEPLLTASSGSEQVDTFVRDYLVKALRIGAVLEPGKYAVSVGP